MAATETFCPRCEEVSEFCTCSSEEGVVLARAHEPPFVRSVVSVRKPSRSNTSNRYPDGGNALTRTSNGSDVSNTDTPDPLASVRNGAWLSEQVFPPLVYAVPDILPAGFAVLAGPPKAGKSYLVLDWLLAVASGGRAIGQIPVDGPRQVFYLALEDSDRRMQTRCREITGQAAVPDYFAYETHIEPGTAVAVIEAFLGRWPQTALVVIDTLGRVMPSMMPGETTYQRDYRVGARLQAITMAHPGLCIVANHHTRKGASPDFVENVSGTNGLPGAADTIVVLSRDRNTAEGTLRITGRDVEEAEYALTSDHGRWVIDGADLAEAATVAQERSDLHNLGTLSQNILAFVAEHPEGVSAKDVAAKFGKNAYTYLRRLDEEGHLDKPSRGYYCIPEGTK